MPGSAQLKGRCARQHEGLLQQMLERLIVHYWVKEEAANAGITVSSSEVERALHLRFPSELAFHRFLTFTGLRAADERFIIEGELLPEKWRRATLPVYARLRRSKPPESEQMVAEVERENGELTQAMTKRWTPRTHCRAGYVVMWCSEHRG